MHALWKHCAIFVCVKGVKNSGCKTKTKKRRKLAGMKDIVAHETIA